MAVGFETYDRSQADPDYKDFAEMPESCQELGRNIVHMEGVRNSKPIAFRDIASNSDVELWRWFSFTTLFFEYVVRNINPTVK